MLHDIVPFYVYVSSDGQVHVQPARLNVPEPAETQSIRLFVTSADPTILDIQPNAAGNIYKDFPPQTDGLETGAKYIPKITEAVQVHVVLQYCMTDADGNDEILINMERWVWIKPFVG